MSKLPTAESESQMQEMIDKYGEENITIYKVHALTAWNSKDEPMFGGWMVLKETENTGETELRQFENSGRKDGKSAKEQAKNYARKLARKNRPAIVVIENRDFETQRVEVAE